jgi:hypothetical protein
MCEDSAPELWQQKYWLLHHGNALSQTCFLTREFFLTKNNMTVFSHPPNAPDLKIKLKGRHFDTNETMEVESQAVLNNLTEHDFQYWVPTHWICGVHKQSKRCGEKAPVPVGTKEKPPWLLVRERSIPTERPPLVDEI